MKISLSKNRPSELSKEEFEKMWDNLGYSLSALYTTLKELSSGCNKVKEDDFTIPNHYALLAFQAGKKAAYEEIAEMLPNSSK